MKKKIFILLLSLLLCSCNNIFIDLLDYSASYLQSTTDTVESEIATSTFSETEETTSTILELESSEESVSEVILLPITEVEYIEDSDFNLYTQETLIYSGNNLSEMYNYIIDENAEYDIQVAEVELVFKNNVQASPIKSFDFTQFPKAKKIKISGVHYPAELMIDGYYTRLSTINFIEEMQLDCDLEISNCRITYYSKIDLNGHTLSLTGYKVTFENCSNKTYITNGTIISHPEYETEFFCKKIDNVNLLIKNGTSYLYGGSVKLNYVELCETGTNFRTMLTVQKSFINFEIDTIKFSDYAGILFHNFSCRNEVKIKNCIYNPTWTPDSWFVFFFVIDSYLPPIINVENFSDKCYFGVLISTESGYVIFDTKTGQVTEQTTERTLPPDTELIYSPTLVKTMIEGVTINDKDLRTYKYHVVDGLFYLE